MSVPSDIFQRATALTLKALGRKAELEIGFAGEAVGVTGARVTLPVFEAGEKTLVRGAADAAAVRLRYHDPKIHVRFAPSESSARAGFEALERARIEGLGARDFAGIARNLADLFERESQREGFEVVSDRAAVPLVEALHLLAWQAFSGRTLPPAPAKAAALWEPWIRERVGTRLDQLATLLGDQKKFAREAQKILKDIHSAGNEDEESGAAESDEQKSNMPPESFPSGQRWAVGDRKRRGRSRAGRGPRFIRHTRR